MEYVSWSTPGGHRIVGKWLKSASAATCVASVRPEGVPESESALDESARTPEAVFAFNPEAVIALAREDAEAVHGRF